jgi:hypothetical protein
VQIAGQRLGKESLTFDTQAQSLADLNWSIRHITTKDTAEQIKLGNPPSDITVDNSATKPLELARKKTVVLFGTTLASTTMRLVETTLKQMIDRATAPRSGRLRNVSGAWRWKYIAPDGATRVVSAATPLPVFVRGSMLVLEPYGVPHATSDEPQRMRGGSLKSRRRQMMRSGQMGPPKREYPVGWRATAETLRSRVRSRDFEPRVVLEVLAEVPGPRRAFQKAGDRLARDQAQARDRATLTWQPSSNASTS